MRKIQVLLLFAFCIGSAYAQNLVVNPSFENIVGTLQCSWYTTQAQFDGAIDGWTCPTGGSTDIFSMSLDQSCYCHPLSTNGSSPGSQLPRTGDVMCNITVYGDGGCDPYREYLQGALTTALTPGQEYLVEFYVSLADNNAYATDNIGVYFTTSPVDVTSMCVYDVTPQLNSTTIVTDAENWTLISFNFTPTQAYTNFMLGNFYYDSETNAVAMGGPKTTLRYFVDDVSVTTVNNTPPTSDFTVGTPVCAGESTNVTYTGTGSSSATYHWSWDGGNVSPGNGQGPHTVYWLTPGMHTVSLWVEENGLSSDVTSHVVDVNPVPTSSFNLSAISCFGDNATVEYTGTASSSATYTWNFNGGSIISGSGQGPYQLNWSSPGTHSVSLMVEENGCSSSQTTHSVVEPDVLQLVLSGTDISCNGADDGEIASSVTGGTSPYSYSWSNSGTSQNISNLSPGTYSLTVTDNAGCTTVASQNIDEPGAVLIVPGDDQQICAGENAVLSASASGGTSPYTYYWNSGSGFIAGTSSEMFSLYSSQDIFVYAEDANGCSSETTSINVSVSSVMSLGLLVNDVTCNGLCNGSAVLNISGGIAPFVFSGDMLSSSANNLCSGAYSVSITDNNACTADTFFVINEPTAIYSTVYTEDVSCHDGEDGVAWVIAAGGTPPYSYHWISGDQNDTAVNLHAGYAMVTVSDANGCISESEGMIGEPPGIIIAGMGNRHICIGGTANITISTTGGSYPYSYYWIGSDGFEWFGENFSVSPDTTTSYTLYVTDNNGCTHEENATVYVHPPLEFLSAFVDQDSVCPGEAVTLYAQPEGGNGGPYELTLDGHIVGLPYEFYPAISGWHYLVLSDACETPSVEDSVYVHVYDLPKNSFISDVVGGCPPLHVQFTEINPDNGYSYSWHFGDGGFAYGQQTYHIYENSGLYDVQLTVTDENGCSRHKAIENMVHAYPVPDIDFYTHPNDLSMLNPRMVFFPVTSYTDSLYWYFGDGDSTLGSHWNPVHTYNGVGEFEVMVIGTNHFECSDTSRKILNVREQFTFYAPTAFTPNYDGNNDCFSVCGEGIDPNEFSLIIYDRWGSIVFEAKEYDSRYGCDGCGDSSWDGSMLGDVSKGDRLLPTGVYPWICVYKDLFGVEHSEQGVIRLVR